MLLNIHVINPTGGFIKKQIEGTMIKLPFCKGFVHRDLLGNWAVTEFTTGFSIYAGAPNMAKKTVIECARLALKERGIAVDNFIKLRLKNLKGKPANV